ncbi:hypothetical protein DO74_901 [Brucella abortus bv. 6 str. 870]|nr:hypothetical protein DO78_894 [Brucella abortus]AIJ63895.1 hypothetical protein DO74_901 [Brucella abortus bv. 6 str. 870]
MGNCVAYNYSLTICIQRDTLGNSVKISWCHIPAAINSLFADNNKGDGVFCQNVQYVDGNDLNSSIDGGTGFNFINVDRININTIRSDVEGCSVCKDEPPLFSIWDVSKVCISIQSSGFGAAKK